MISARDPAEVARLATSSGALILGADHAVLRLQDPETRRYVIRSYYGSADGRLEEKLFRLDKQVDASRCCAAARRAVLRELPASTRPDVRSALAAPLRRDGTRDRHPRPLRQDRPGPLLRRGLRRRRPRDLHPLRLLRGARRRERALLRSGRRSQRSFDEETGLPNADYLARRIDQELARAAGRDGALALATCRVENLDAIRRAAGPVADRVVLRVAEALRVHLRDFDVLGRTGDDEFVVLLARARARPRRTASRPSPGASPTTSRRTTA